MLAKVTVVFLGGDWTPSVTVHTITVFVPILVSTKNIFLVGPKETIKHGASL